MNRTLWFCEDLSDTSADGQFSTRHEVADESSANLVSSLLDDGRHAPALDIDLPCELRPSSTQGHYHLLIERPMSWRSYRRLLRALKRAGIIEPGYYRASLERRQTFLRLPHVKKTEGAA